MSKCESLKGQAEKPEDGRFDASSGTRKRDDGLSIHCFTELQSNVDAFQGDSNDRAVAENES